MRILALDTSGQSTSVAVMEGKRLIFEAFERTGQTHSARLMALTEQALVAADWSISDVERIAAVVGPGSYTGVRIGVSTARGLAQGAGVSCVGIDALETLVARVCGLGFSMVCPLLDARAGQVYGAAFDCSGESPVRLIEDTACSLNEFWEILLNENIDNMQRIIFTGDGAEHLRDQIICRFGGRALMLPDSFMYPRASAAGLLALGKAALAYSELLPLYLRAPQAERERLTKESSQANP